MELSVEDGMFIAVAGFVLYFFFAMFYSCVQVICVNASDLCVFVELEQPQSVEASLGNFDKEFMIIRAEGS